MQNCFCYVLKVFFHKSGHKCFNRSGLLQIRSDLLYYNKVNELFNQICIPENIVCPTTLYS